MSQVEYARLKTLSPIYTGDVERRSKEAKSSGILGSLRWWYETLVRGLDGYACDPTEPDSCRFDSQAYQGTNRVEDGLKDVCPACRLFGCTGWSRKFSLLTTNKEGKVGAISLDKPGIEFGLKFIVLKPFAEEERWLLSKTLWLIAQYGSMGGRTTLKPPRFPDYGLVKLTRNIESPKAYPQVAQWVSTITEGSDYLSSKLRTMPSEYPNLKNFFFNPGCWLDRRGMNQLVSVDKTGFMKATQGVSKKLFSFSKGEGKRFWGYTTDQGMLNSVLTKLTQMGIRDTKVGKEVLNEL